jgi:hypothetical protein
MAARVVTGAARRTLQAHVCQIHADGSPRKAESLFGWNRSSVAKGIDELKNGRTSTKPSMPRIRFETREPQAIEKVKSLLAEHTQADPKMTSTRLYTRVTGSALRKLFAESLNIPAARFPCSRTCQRILNRNGHFLRKVRKTIPLKKIKETDQIFANIRRAHQRAENDQTILRISTDCKARTKIGPYSRNGKTRDAKDMNAADHDMGGTTVTPVGILEVAESQLSIRFVEGPCTSDTIVDFLDDWWRTRKAHYPHIRTIMIDLDNGSQIASNRRQFISRMLDFCNRHGIEVELVYYPPYHSKYNMIERCWGVLEQHWNGTLLRTIEDAVRWAATMTWRSVSPIVERIDKIYEKGKTLNQSVFKALNKKLRRTAEIEKWSVVITPEQAVASG